MATKPFSRNDVISSGVAIPAAVGSKVAILEYVASPRLESRRNAQRTACRAWTVWRNPFKGAKARWWWLMDAVLRAVAVVTANERTHGLQQAVLQGAPRTVPGRDVPRAVQSYPTYRGTVAVHTSTVAD